jgi:hypothetical protein
LNSDCTQNSFSASGNANQCTPPKPSGATAPPGGSAPWYLPDWEDGVDSTNQMIGSIARSHTEFRPQSSHLLKNSHDLHEHTGEKKSLHDHTGEKKSLHGHTGEKKSLHDHRGEKKTLPITSEKSSDGNATALHCVYRRWLPQSKEGQISILFCFRPSSSPAIAVIPHNHPLPSPQSRGPALQLAYLICPQSYVDAGLCYFIAC